MEINFWQNYYIDCKWKLILALFSKQRFKLMRVLRFRVDMLAHIIIIIWSRTKENWPIFLTLLKALELVMSIKLISTTTRKLFLLYLIKVSWQDFFLTDFKYHPVLKNDKNRNGRSSQRSCNKTEL